MKPLIYLVIYSLFLTIVFGVLLGYTIWKVETLPERLELTMQTVSRQMAIDSECVDENEFYNHETGIDEFKNRRKDDKPN